MMPLTNDEATSLDSNTLKGTVLLVWRVVMLLGLLGVAFQTGQERAKINEKLVQMDKVIFALQDILPRVKSLESWQTSIMVLAESRDVRLRNIETDYAGLEVRIDGLEYRAKILEDRYENLKKSELLLPNTKRLVER